MCEMAGIVDDEEIARIIAESDSDWASESDDSFETSLESDSSVPDKKPKVTVHRIVHQVGVMSQSLTPPVVIGRKSQTVMTRRYTT